MEYESPEALLRERIAVLRKRETDLLDELGAVAEERAKREDQWLRLREETAERRRDEP